MSDIPLTPEQRLFAAEHHGLVYTFLNNKHLPESEFYDVIIFGYLNAVHDYLTRKDLQNYSFSTIAWRDMSRSLSNYYRDQHRQKRNATVISIHISRPDNDLPLEETIGSPDELMQQLETRLLLHDLARSVSKQQMDITPPVASASNHIPPKNEPSEIIIAQSPGADFSLKIVPNRSPNPMNIIADGISVTKAVRSPTGFISTPLINEIISATKNDINV